MFNKRKLAKSNLKALIAAQSLRQAQTGPNQPLHAKPLSPVAFEPLEGRSLMSGGPFGFEGGFDGGGHGHGSVSQTITFSEAPAAVQTGLDTLASTDGVTAPASTTTVYLGNANGIESYTVDITGTGTQTRLTVDQNGDPVTAPTQSLTTFGAITNTAVTAEITAIASALSLTAPTSTTLVNVSTASDGTATYTIALASSSTSTTTSSWDGNTIIRVDSAGDPVGNERIPFSTLSSAIQSGLTTNAPTGATALTSTSLIDVKTVDGITTYTADYTSSGTTSTVTVNSSGTLVSLPSTTTADFSTIPTAAQTELQNLATADGVSTAISSTQTVDEYVETNGTTIYSVTLDATSTSGTTTSSTYTITLSVDASGNPTVPPTDFGGGPGGFAGGFGGGNCGGNTSTTSTGTTTTSGTTSTTSSLTSSDTVAATAVVSAQVLHPSDATPSSSTSSETTSTSDVTTTTRTSTEKKEKKAQASHKHHKKAS